MNQAFWKAWKLKKKQLKKIQPQCTCGKKHPDKTYHKANCPYLQFWNKQFIAYKAGYKQSTLC